MVVVEQLASPIILIRMEYRHRQTSGSVLTTVVRWTTLNMNMTSNLALQIQEVVAHGLTSLLYQCNRIHTCQRLTCMVSMVAAVRPQVVVCKQSMLTD